MSSTIGSFTIGVARLAEHGEMVYSGASPSGFEDRYIVVMPDGETRATLDNVSGLPAVGDAAGGSGGLSRLRVSTISFRQRDGFSPVWDIAVRYERRAGPGNGGDEDSCSWGTCETSCDVVSDADDETGAALLNSAGDAFDSVPQKVCYGAEITYRSKTSTFPAAYEKTGYINNADVTLCGVDFPKHTAMLRVEVEDSGDEFGKRYQVTYTVSRRVNVVRIPSGCGYEEKDIGWDVAFAQCGFQYLDDEGEKRKFTVEADDGTVHEVSSPQPLDENGKPSDVAAVRVIRVYPECAFGSIGIPS